MLQYWSLCQNAFWEVLIYVSWLTPTMQSIRLKYYIPPIIQSLISFWPVIHMWYTCIKISRRKPYCIVCGADHPIWSHSWSEVQQSTSRAVLLLPWNRNHTLLLHVDIVFFWSPPPNWACRHVITPSHRPFLPLTVFEGLVIVTAMKACIFHNCFTHLARVQSVWLCSLRTLHFGPCFYSVSFKNIPSSIAICSGCGVSRKDKGLRHVRMGSSLFPLPPDLWPTQPIMADPTCLPWEHVFFQGSLKTRTALTLRRGTLGYAPWVKGLLLNPISSERKSGPFFWSHGAEREQMCSLFLLMRKEGLRVYMYVSVCVFSFLLGGGLRSPYPAADVCCSWLYSSMISVWNFILIQVTIEIIWFTYVKHLCISFKILHFWGQDYQDDDFVFPLYCAKLFKLFKSNYIVWEHRWEHYYSVVYKWNWLPYLILKCKKYSVVLVCVQNYRIN